MRISRSRLSAPAIRMTEASKSSRGMVRIMSASAEVMMIGALRRRIAKSAASCEACTSEGGEIAANGFRSHPRSRWTRREGTSASMDSPRKNASSCASASASEVSEVTATIGRATRNAASRNISALAAPRSPISGKRRSRSDFSRASSSLAASFRLRSNDCFSSIF